MAVTTKRTPCQFCNGASSKKSKRLASSLLHSCIMLWKISHGRQSDVNPTIRSDLFVHGLFVGSGTFKFPISIADQHIEGMIPHCGQHSTDSRLWIRRYCLDSQRRSVQDQHESNSHLLGDACFLWCRRMAIRARMPATAEGIVKLVFTSRRRQIR